MTTPLQDLVREWLGNDQDPVAFIRAARGDGEPKRSWDLVAVDLYDATGRRRWIPPETLRIWLRDADG